MDARCVELSLLKKYVIMDVIESMGYFFRDFIFLFSPSLPLSLSLSLSLFPSSLFSFLFSLFTILRRYMRGQSISIFSLMRKVATIIMIMLATTPTLLSLMRRARLMIMSQEGALYNVDLFPHITFNAFALSALSASRSRC